MPDIRKLTSTEREINYPIEDGEILTIKYNPSKLGAKMEREELELREEGVTFGVVPKQLADMVIEWNLDHEVTTKSGKTKKEIIPITEEAIGEQGHQLCQFIMSLIWQDYFAMMREWNQKRRDNMQAITRDHV